VLDGGIPESTWGACEFHCLSRNALTTAQSIAHEATHVGPFLSVPRRRADVLSMRNAKADCERLRSDYGALHAPEDAAEQRGAILGVLERVESLCDTALSYWEQVLSADPSGSADAYKVHHDKLLRALTQGGLEPQEIAADLTEMLDRLDRQLALRGITPVAR
jgi:hypothetical protein